MSFEYKEYYSGLVGISLFVIVVAIIIILVSIILFFFHDRIVKITKINYEKRNLKFNFFPIIVLLIFGFATLNYNFMKDDNNILYQTEGIITNVSDIQYNPKFTYEGKRVRPKHLTIDGEIYYVMYIGDFQVGDKVRLEYLLKSKVVLSIELIPADLE